MTIEQAVTGEIPFLREDEASGRVAEVFADIRATMQVGTVNLIWRHLAVQPDALDCAWQAARPIYVGGAVGDVAGRLCAQLALPAPRRWSPAVLRVAGIDDTARATVQAVVDTYNRGNAFNLLTLSALLMEPMDRHIGDSPGDGSLVLPPPALPLPPVPELETLAPHVAALVRELNTFGAVQDGLPLVATLYKHLAHWPGMLNLAWGLLAPMVQDGTLDLLVADTRRRAQHAARMLATQRGAMPPGAARDTARGAIQAFVAQAICRMLPIGLMMRSALSD